MSVTHPSPSKLALLQRRWEGQEARLSAIARDLLEGRDWTVNLVGLPLVDEVPPQNGEVCGRDLRGADLRRFLTPAPEIREAGEADAALVAGISLEGLTHNTPLDGATPFPVVHESTDDIARAMRRGDRFLVARAAGNAVGVVRWGQRSEFKEWTADRNYVELSGLAVRPHARRQGIGLALVNAVHAQSTAGGFDHVLLRTTLELGLVPWYERAGYRTSLVRQLTCTEGPTILDVVMVRRLGVGVSVPSEPVAAPHAASARPGPSATPPQPPRVRAVPPALQRTEPQAALPRLDVDPSRRYGA